MLKETADVILEDKVYSFYIDYPVTKRRFFKSVTETERKEFSIKPLCLHSMTKISREVLKINPELIKGNMVTATYGILVANSRAIQKIIAYAVLNNDQEPDSELLNIIGYMNSNDLKEAFKSVLEQLDVSGFISSIILIRSVNLMEMNPKDEGS